MRATAVLRTLGRVRSHATRLVACTALLALPATVTAGPVAIDLVRPGGVGTDEVFRDPNWLNDFSLLVIFYNRGNPHLLSYQRQSGAMTLHRVQSDGRGLVSPVAFNGDAVFANFTSIIDFEMGGRAHFLLYSKETGDTRVWRIKPDADGFEVLATGSSAPGWGAFASFQLDGQPYFAAFKESTREFSISRINPDGTITATWLNQWATTWTSFMPYVHAGQPHLMTYNKETGQIAMRRINSGGRGTTDLKYHPVDARNTGITSPVPFEVNGRPHYLNYRLNTGDVSIRRIGLDGVTLESVWANDPQWSPGWTSIVSFVANGQPHILSYKGGTF